MTIDCLGILTELSDCKHNLFPVGYQWVLISLLPRLKVESTEWNVIMSFFPSRCSRVYWSTLDARKRCVYTCRILVCHPPVVKSDAKAVIAPEENRTIAHSPPPMTGNRKTLLVSIKVLLQFIVMLLKWVYLYTDFPDPFECLRRSETLSPTNTPKLRVYTRNRHPSYPTCQRPSGPRTVSSPGA